MMERPIDKRRARTFSKISAQEVRHSSYFLLRMPATPLATAPSAPSFDTDAVRFALATKCREFVTKECTQAGLVKVLLQHKHGVSRLEGDDEARSEAVYRLSLLFKRVEKTCKVHLCALWNEVCAAVAVGDCPWWRRCASR